MGYVAGTAQTSTVTPICIATEYAQYPEYHSVGQTIKISFYETIICGACFVARTEDFVIGGIHIM